MPFLKFSARSRFRRSLSRVLMTVPQDLPERNVLLEAYSAPR